VLVLIGQVKCWQKKKEKKMCL